MVGKISLEDFVVDGGVPAGSAVGLQEAALEGFDCKHQSLVPPLTERLEQLDSSTESPGTHSHPKFDDEAE